MDYQSSLKHYRDLKNSIDTARLEGIEEGIKLGLEKVKQIEIEKGKQIGKIEGQLIEKAKIAKNLKNLGFDIRDIIAATGLSLEEIEKL